MTFPTIVHCDGVGLFLDEDEEDGLLLVEGGELGRFLEYTQPGSVRKQVLSDWKEHFRSGEDFVLEKFAFERRDWVKRRKAMDDATLLPVVHSRLGRIFLTEAGLAKFLRMTAKPRAHTLQLALAAVSPAFRAPDLEPLEDHVSSKPSDPQADSSTARAPERSAREFARDPASSDQALDHRSSDPDRGGDLERLRFRHEVYQQLLSNAYKYRSETDLLRLALTAAEDALGHRVEGIRMLEAVRAPQPTPEAARAPSTDRTATPTRTWLVAPTNSRVFTNGWHTMSEIGSRAGGYSAVSAGKAADIVAANFHVSPHELRTSDTPFSRVKQVRDSSTGKPRPQVEFNSDVANLIVDTLRTLSEFRPKERPELAPFGAGAEDSPKLSRPVDLSDAASSPGDA